PPVTVRPGHPGPGGLPSSDGQEAVRPSPERPGAGPRRQRHVALGGAYPHRQLPHDRAQSRRLPRPHQ
ncbi:unnamed protein product, partial [Prorocentrum cordatum]